jgi:hypothetical protein
MVLLFPAALSVSLNESLVALGPSPGRPGSRLGPPFHRMFNFRQGLVNPEKNDQDLTINPDPQGPQQEEEHALPQVMGLARLKMGGSINNHNEADDDTEDGADPEENLDDDRSDHGPKRPEIAHENLLLR